MKWTRSDIPDQSGRLALVTGANSGIGYETALALAHAGATVVLACRSESRGQAAVDAIAAESPPGEVSLSQLDLADLASVKAFAERFAAEHDQLDLLVANAGVMMPPSRQATQDGFELQFGVNHLGHFALVGRLLDRLLAAPAPRVVTVSSLAHKQGRIAFDDLNWERRRYRRWKSYSQSKLANLLFTYELRRRAERAGQSLLVAAAHPGWTATNLQRDTSLFRFLNPMMAMKPWQGALPTLYAATAPDVSSGDYIGPSGLGEMRGWPKRVKSVKAARDPEVAARLWDASTELTGVTYDALSAAATAA